MSGSNITDFTFESWIYLPNTSSQYGFFSNQTGDNNANTMRIGTSGGSAMWMKIGSNSLQTSSGTVPSTRWFHLAVTRSGSTVTIYLDGINSATMSTSDYINASGFYVGVTYPTTTFRLNGYMQDVRFYTSAKYTSNFVPASPNPDILPDTPSGVNGGSKLAKITDGAVAFDGSSDYLSVPDSDDFDLAGNDWTVEAFVYHSNTNYASYEGILAQWVAGSGTSRTWTLETVGSGATSDLEFYYYDTSNNFVGPVQGGTLSKNRWHHVAACRSGNTIYMFVDGVMYGSGTSISVDIKNSTDPLWVGRVVDGYWNGYISNARVVNGTALYTSNFTPPTRELTNVTNTKLLCCQSNTSAIDTTVVPGTAPNTRNWSARSNWNSGGTLTNASSYPLTAAFDGNLSTTFAMSYAGGMIWTAPSTISFSSSIEVYVNSSIGTGGQGFIATISGVQQSKVDLNAAGSWETLYSGSGTFDKLEITRNNGGNNNNLWISAIRVDGTVLVDAIAGYGDAAATNFNPFNTSINTVRGQETGYATLNPLDNTGITKLVNGNLDFRRSVNDGRINSTIAASSGKWYAECQVGNDTLVGVSEVSSQTNTYPGGNAGSYGYFSGGFFYDAGSGGAYAASFTTDDYIGCILDLDNGTIAYTKNGVSQGVAKTGLPAGSYRFSSRGGRHDGTETLDRWNFGQNPSSFHHQRVSNH